MSHRTKLIVSFLLVIVGVMTIFSVFTDAALVKGDFSVESSNQKITVCKGSVFTDTLTISDTSGVNDNFRIIASPWADAVPDKITIGGKGTVYNLIKPPADTKTGLYEISTLIMKGSSAVELKQIVEVVDCSFDVDIEQNSFSNCPCLPTIYDFVVKNDGNSKDIYDLFINLPSDQYELSEVPLILGPGESRHVYATVTMPCDNLGKYGLSFVVLARSTGRQVVVPFYLVTKEGCYDHKILMNDSFDFCISDDAKIPFTIQNNGLLNQSFDIELFSGTGNLSNDFVKHQVVSAGGKVSSLIGVFTGQAADFNATLRITGKAESKDKHFDVKINDCAADKKLRLNIFVGLIVFLILFIMIVLFLLFRATGKDLSDDESQSKKRINIWYWIVLLILIILIIFFVKFGALSILASVWGLVLLYKLYILIGFILMIFLLTYFWLVPGKRDLRFMFFLIIIGSILFLLLALCFFTGYCSRVGLTNPVVTEGMNETSVDIPVPDSTTYIWNKNSVKELDLSRYIVNPDDDLIDIQATHVDNISIEIDGMNVLFRPEKDWYGTRVINFIARDGRGSSAVSPDIDLIVLDRESSGYDGIIRFIAIYGNFILVGFFLTVIIVILFILMVYTRKKPKRIIVRKRRKINK